MLSAADNELMCRVGRGTPMGDVMRQYWIPALMSSELPKSDSDQVRVRLLGEDLIAFRDTSGRVGLFANSCPHRGASLFYARNEDGGLRCVYHGWKYDVTGKCVDMPSEPAESNFRDKIRATAYPCQERGGIVWTYMGSRNEPPPLPDIEPNMMEGEPNLQMVMRECNYVQALEGDIDTSHLGFLHMGGIDPNDVVPKTFDFYTVNHRSPRYNVLDTDYRVMYAAYRPAEEDTYYYRFAQFMMPFYTEIPTGTLGVQVLVRAWIPIDDDHTMFWNIMAPDQFFGGRSSAKDGKPFPGAAGRTEFVPNTTDWLGRWRLAADSSNDYKIDRESQRNGNYTGIDGISLQDQAITESMGTIYQRGNEHLGTSDTMVIRTRRRLINTAKALSEHGTVPPGVDDPELYRVRSGGVVMPRDADWLGATDELRKGFVKHDPNEVGFLT